MSRGLGEIVCQQPCARLLQSIGTGSKFTFTPSSTGIRTPGTVGRGGLEARKMYSRLHVESTLRVSMRFKQNMLLGAALALWLQVAPLQAAIFCTGKLDNVALDSGGSVLISVGGSAPIHQICNTASQGSFQTQVPACKAMFATLLAARMADRQIRAYYNDPALTSCSQIAIWSVQPSFYFVELP